MQIKSLASWILYHVSQGRIAKGEAIDEQLAARGLTAADIDYMLLTHLDCDHAYGLRAVVGAKHILCSPEELKCACKNSFVRYQKKWWRGVDLRRVARNPRHRHCPPHD